MKFAVFILILNLFCQIPIFAQVKIKDSFDLTFYMEHIRDKAIYRILGVNLLSLESNQLEFDWTTDGNTEITVLEENTPDILANMGTALDFGYLFFPFKVYILAGVERRESLELEYRCNGGVGGKIYFMKNDTVNWSISFIPLVLWEKYFSKEPYFNCRLSFRHKLVLTFLEGVMQLSTVTFYQPLATDLIYSLIIDTTNTLAINYSKNVAIIFKYEFDLDINREVNVEVWKSVFSGGIKLSF
jgi:hypothetical protein